MKYVAVFEDKTRWGTDTDFHVHVLLQMEADSDERFRKRLFHNWVKFNGKSTPKESYRIRAEMEQITISHLRDFDACDVFSQQGVVDYVIKNGVKDIELVIES